MAEPGLQSAVSALLGGTGNADPALVTDLSSGLEGLEYLTGKKKKKVRTFFDDHPVQSTLSDLSNIAVPAGATAAVGGTLWNTMQDVKNSDRVRRIREGVPRTSLLSPELSQEQADLFGVINEEAHNQSRAGSLPDTPATRQRRKMLHLISHDGTLLPTQLGQRGYVPDRLVTATNDLRALQRYADVTGMARTLQNYQPHARLFESRDAAKDRVLANLFRDELVSGGVSANDDVLRQIVANLSNEQLTPDPSGAHPRNPLVGQRLGERGERILTDIKSPGGIKRMLSLVKTPALVGGGLMVGGVAFGTLLQMLRNRLYGKEKLKEYKKNLLMTKGRFEEAESL